MDPGSTAPFQPQPLWLWWRVACLQQQPGCKAARPGIRNAVLAPDPTNTHTHSTQVHRGERGTGEEQAEVSKKGRWGRGRKDRLDEEWSAACRIKVPAWRGDRREDKKKENSQSQVLLRRCWEWAKNGRKQETTASESRSYWTQINPFSFWTLTGNYFQGDVWDQIYTLQDISISNSEQKNWPQVMPIIFEYKMD